MRLISHSEYDVDEFSRHSLPYPFPQPMTDRCKSVCFWLYFPLFSVKVAADHAHNTRGKFPSPGPWWHSALTKSFIYSNNFTVCRSFHCWIWCLVVSHCWMYLHLWDSTCSEYSYYVFNPPECHSLFYVCINTNIYLNETSATQLDYVYGSLGMFDCLYCGMRL